MQPLEQKTLTLKEKGADYIDMDVNWLNNKYYILRTR